jgi:hypothetical protein
MNTQEIFDKVAKHLLTQNAKSGDGSNYLYRGPNGMMCAVGCLIDDKAYRPDFEKHRITSPTVKDALLASGIVCQYDNESLLTRLQMIHDYKDVVNWKQQLESCANHFGLKFTPV